MTQLLNKPNFYIFTGGPGAGKTTVLNELAKHNLIGNLACVAK